MRIVPIWTITIGRAHVTGRREEQDEDPISKRGEAARGEKRRGKRKRRANKKKERVWSYWVQHTSGGNTHKAERKGSVLGDVTV